MNMIPNKPILQPGQPSIEKRYKGKTMGYRFIAPVEFVNHLKEAAKQNKVSTAEYLRRLIADDMGVGE